MGRKYYSIKTLPEPLSVVWCRYPLIEKPKQPGPIARPTLVWQTSILFDEEGVEYGTVTVSYGGDAKGAQPAPDSKDLIISDWPTVKALGLHKPTRFSANPDDRPELIWGSDYFSPPEYLKFCKIKICELDEPMTHRLKGCLKTRGL